MTTQNIIDCWENGAEPYKDTFAEASKIEFFQDTGELPLDYLREYDGAAEHFARHGELPMCMGSPGALDYINADPEAFEQRVREMKYGIAMEAIHAKFSGV